MAAKWVGATILRPNTRADGISPPAKFVSARYIFEYLRMVTSDFLGAVVHVNMLGIPDSALMREKFNSSK